ncbi:MAG: hypothetical protein KC713_09080, partial [Candidatus Omnitrophica bacterium]|nr:hypothetical protein [Candidatus Omnitrophota bacterium]
MKKLVLLGHSLAFKSFIEHYRQQDQDSAITLVPVEPGRLIYDKLNFYDFLTAQSSKASKDLIDQSFLKQHKVGFENDAQISRIQLKKHKIFTAAKKQIDFTHLLIADLPQSRFSVKGGQKE